jgi:hypothetical protein
LQKVTPPSAGHDLRSARTILEASEGLGFLPKRLAVPVASQRQCDARRIDALLSDRDRLMNEIALRARLAPLPPMLAKAQTLLTRFWGRSNWNARSELLAAARLLITLGAAQPALKAQRGIQARHSTPSSGAARGRKVARASRKIVEMA